MYKKLLIAMSVLALAACQKNKLVQSNPGNAISFQAVTDYALNGSTRAAAATSAIAGTDTNLPSSSACDNEAKIGTTFTDFTVYGFNDGNIYTFNPKTTGALVVSEPSANPTTADWTYTGDTYYWPNTKKGVDFYAYSPKESAENVLTFTPSLPQPTAEGQASTKQLQNVNVASADVDGQKDLIIAEKAGATSKDNGGKVSLLFSHALSQITVEAACANSNYIVKVKGVKIVYVDRQGTFTFPEAATTTTKRLLTNCWTDTQGKDETKQYWSVMLHTAKGIQLTKEYQSVMSSKNNFFLIPQTGTAQAFVGGNGADAKKFAATRGAYLSLLVQITDNNGNKIFPKADGYRYTSIPLITGGKTSTSFTWEPGKKYIYKINFFKNGGAGNADPVQNPTPPVPNDKEQPVEDPKGVKGGDPVADSTPIIFAPPTVDPWVDGETIEIEL